MTFQENIQSQYLAALKMLHQVVTDCPDSLWNDSTYRNPFWHVAYHSLFYTHLYLHPGLRSFSPWSKHRPEMHRLPTAGEAYSKAEILEYYELVCQDVAHMVPAAALEEPSGFDWLPFNRLETHFYNIRHIHQHIGELSERLGVTAEVDLKWVIKV